MREAVLAKGRNELFVALGHHQVLMEGGMDRGRDGAIVS